MMWMTVAAVIGSVAGVHQLYHHVIRPRRRRTKILHAYDLIEQWFNAVDQTVEHGFDLPLIYNLEDRVTRYLEEHSLQLVPLTFDLSFRRRFLRGCGPAELRDDPKTFERYARTRVEGTTLGLAWGDLIRAFHEFRRKYEEKSPETNFADIEMRLRLIRMYIRVPAR